MSKDHSIQTSQKFRRYCPLKHIPYHIDDFHPLIANPISPQNTHNGILMHINIAFLAITLLKHPFPFHKCKLVKLQNCKIHKQNTMKQ